MAEEFTVNDELNLHVAPHTISEIGRESMSVIPEKTDAELWAAPVEKEEEEENPDEDGEVEEAVKYSLTFKHNDSVVGEVQELEEGAAITSPEAPEGYHWKDVPATMPANDLVIESEVDGANE